MRTSRLTAIVLLLACWSATGCKSDDPMSGTQFFPIAFSDFTAAQTLQVTSPQTQVIRDQAAWDTFWQVYGPFGSSAPNVDFAQEMLIGVFWGAQGTGCFSFVDSIVSVQVRITGVNTLGVLEIDIGPLPDLGSCATPVNPLQVILLDTTITTVDFIGMVPS